MEAPAFSASSSCRAFLNSLEHGIDALIPKLDTIAASRAKPGPVSISRVIHLASKLTMSGFSSLSG